MMDIARRAAHPPVVEPRHERTASENDLTVRLTHAEEALGARELNFQLIVESIPALVAVLTPTGQVEALNQPVLDYFGKSFEELTGWANSDVVHPDDLAHMTESLRKALARGESYELESRHRRQSA